MTRTVLLGDICDIKIGRTPPRKQPQWFSESHGIKWVSIKDMGNTGKYISQTSELLTADAIKKFNIPIIPAGTLLMSFKLTVGRLGFTEYDMCSNEAIAQLPIKDPDIVDKNYLYYYLKNFNFGSLSSTSSIATAVNSKTVKNISVNLPPLDQQKKIANILGSLDEKIELNRRMNETLEQLGQALFRHYFVDNPEAKSWDDVKVGELVDIKGGGTPSTKNSSFWGGDIVWSSPRDLANQRCHFLMRTDKTITKQGLSKISSGMLPAGTLLLSSRAPIGYIAFAGVDMAINQGYIAFLPKAKLSNYFIYFWLKNNIQKIKDSANGSTFLEISKTAFRNIYIKQPNQLLHNKFQYEAMIILDKIRDNEAEIYNLTSLRDSLLPKLISGEIEV